MRVAQTTGLMTINTLSIRKNRNTLFQPRILIFSLLFAFTISTAMPVQAKDYDLVILNGRVMDPESGMDEVRNVGIKDGKIAVITKKTIKGKESIDASGHVVAPGFMDGHFHNMILMCRC